MLLHLNKNEPIYKISGQERRELKKELSELKSYAKGFWRYHQLDVDMDSIYGGANNYVLSDNKAQEKFNKIKNQIETIQTSLNELRPVF